ncbi:MAG: YceD family protein, partial [Microvirga sp.]
QDFGLPGIQALSGDYHLQASAKGIHVTGVVKASITQICVTTLEPFDSMIEEEVEVDFAESSGMPAEPPTDIHEYEPPDEIVNGQIDLGALTAEFLVLGLDPYPRKPGVDFSYRDPADEKDSPFAALNKLKGSK